jgi:hypothetical protein
MTPQNHTPKTITIPDNLSPRAAMALHDLLVEMAETVWRHYEPVLVPLIISEFAPKPDDPDFDGEIPF